jgi:predicted DNA binding CopG/RHH family protein
MDHGHITNSNNILTKTTKNKQNTTQKFQTHKNIKDPKHKLKTHKNHKDPKERLNFRLTYSREHNRKK